MGGVEKGKVKCAVDGIGLRSYNTIVGILWHLVLIPWLR